MFMLRVTIMSFIFLCSKQSFIFLCSKQDILTPQFTMDTEHVDQTYKNNPNVQPGPDPTSQMMKTFLGRW